MVAVAGVRAVDLVVFFFLRVVLFLVWVVLFVADGRPADDEVLAFFTTVLSWGLAGGCPERAVELRPIRSGLPDDSVQMILVR